MSKCLQPSLAFDFLDIMVFSMLCYLHMVLIKKCISIGPLARGTDPFTLLAMAFYTLPAKRGDWPTLQKTRLRLFD